MVHKLWITIENHGNCLLSKMSLRPVLSGLTSNFQANCNASHLTRPAILGKGECFVEDSTVCGELKLRENLNWEAQLEQRSPSGFRLKLKWSSSNHKLKTTTNVRFSIANLVKMQSELTLLANQSNNQILNSLNSQILIPFSLFFLRWHWKDIYQNQRQRHAALRFALQGAIHQPAAVVQGWPQDRGHREWADRLLRQGAASVLHAGDLVAAAEECPI